MSAYRLPLEANYPISQGYGETITNPKGHTGIDYACPEGTPVLASAEGIIVFAGWDSTGYGNCVVIQHNDNNASLYAHLSRICVVLRQKVEQGQIIGYSGNTGNSTGPHLHFETRSNWKDSKSHFDPMKVIGTDAQEPEHDTVLKSDFEAGDLLTVQCPLGAKGFANPSFTDWSAYPIGSQFIFTGWQVTRESNGLTYLACVPLVYIAAHDGDVQILDSEEN